MIAESLKALCIPLSQIKPDPRNARQHPAPNLAAIKKSLEVYGQRKPIVVNKRTGHIEAGNGLYMAAKALGWADMAVVYVDDDKDTATGYGLMDNQSALLADWDLPNLKDLLQELDTGTFDMDATGFSSEELERLMTQTHQGLTDDDEVPEQVETICKTGDLWQLGNHRLVCGDATKREDVERLMDGERADMVFTDPPYGVGYDGGAKKRDNLANDQVGTTIYVDALPNLRTAAADHAALYLWYADAHVAAAAAAAAAAGYVITSQIVWVKNHAQFMSSAHYHGKHEPCFYAHRKGQSAQWFGGKTQVTVWEINRANANEYHPTQKPVLLAETAIVNSSSRDQSVLDMFGGSGSTLIACEKLDRKCYMMEIDEHYCDVIIQRWQNYTGKTAERIDA